MAKSLFEEKDFIKKIIVFSPNQAKIRLKKKMLEKMAKCFDKKMPWKKKSVFSPNQPKIRLKIFFLKKWLSVFFIWHVSGSNDRGKKILFSLHILTLWAETYPKMYSTSLYLLRGGHNPPPGIWDFLVAWPFITLIPFWFQFFISFLIASFLKLSLF